MRWRCVLVYWRQRPPRRVRERREDVRARVGARQTLEAVLDDDHRAVDDEAEVHGAEAHEIHAGSRPRHADRREQHGERDRQRGDDRGTEVAEQREQHDDDEERAFGEIRADGIDGRVDEPRAIEDGLRADVDGKRARDRGHLAIDGVSYRATVGAEQHHRGADHDLLAVLGGASSAKLTADLDGRDVAYSDRYAATLGDGNLGDLGLVAYPSVGANREGLAIVLDVAAPRLELLRSSASTRS